MFTQLVLVLASKGFLSLEVEYIDGTKIESKANRYTFVWRKSVEKNREKLMGKSKSGPCWNRRTMPRRGTTRKRTNRWGSPPEGLRK